MNLISRSVKHKMRKANTDQMHKTVLLLLIQREGKVTIKQLADLFFVRISAVSELVQKLEDDELILRKCPQKNEDKRLRYITLSADGKKYLQKLSKKIDEKTEGFFKNLSEDEINNLSELLYKLFNKNIKDES